MEPATFVLQCPWQAERRGQHDVTIAGRSKSRTESQSPPGRKSNYLKLPHVRTHLKPGSPQRTRGGVSGPCEPMGRRGTGKRTVVSTGVGLGKKMGATSVGIEGTKGKQCLWSVSVVAPLVPPGGADIHALYTRVGAPEVLQSMRFPIAPPVGTERSKNKACLSEQSMGGRAH